MDPVATKGCRPLQVTITPLPMLWRLWSYKAILTVFTVLIMRSWSHSIQLYFIIVALGLTPAGTLPKRLRNISIDLYPQFKHVSSPLRVLWSCGPLRVLWSKPKWKLRKNWKLKCSLRFLLEWLVLAAGSFEDISFYKGTKNINLSKILGWFRGRT